MGHERILNFLLGKPPSTPLVTASFIYPLQRLNVLNVIIFFFVIKVLDCVCLLLSGLPLSFLYSLFLLVLGNFFHWYWTELTILSPQSTFPCTRFLFSVLCTFFFTYTFECLYFLVIAARPVVFCFLWRSATSECALDLMSKASLPEVGSQSVSSLSRVEPPAYQLWKLPSCVF